jgi:hypothetical protein
MIACNDGIILRNHISRILRHHFRGKPYYADLLDLFNEVAPFPDAHICLYWAFRSFHLLIMLFNFSRLSSRQLQVSCWTLSQPTKEKKI